MKSERIAIVYSFLTVAAAVGQETSPAPAAAIAPVATAEAAPVINDAPRVSRALIICGLTGDEDHRKLFGETIERLYGGLTKKHGFLPENIVLLWSDELKDVTTPKKEELKPAPAAPAENAAAETTPAAAEPVAKEPSPLTTSRGPATRETIAAVAAELAQKVGPGDALWVFVIGHAHYDARYSWLNLPGPDMQHIEFGKLFANVRCREQAFFITSPASGFYFKSLSQPGRIVIAATEPDLELNETIYPQHLSRTLAEPPPYKELDVDEDGQLTLLDAHLYTCQALAKEYGDNMLLSTEHALLDDTGDARGAELQADFLPEELGGRMQAGRAKPIHRAGDGALARSVLLDLPAPPMPDDTEPTVK